MNNSADLLAETTQTSAEHPRLTFVDARPAFTGHAVCSSDEWLDGRSDPASESCRPNVARQQACATPVAAAMGV